MIELREHQKIAVDYCNKNKKVLLDIDAGLGKTAMAIRTFKEDEKIVIICPATLKLNWLNEIKKFCTFKADVQVIKKRTDIIKSKIVIVNYELLGKKQGKKIINTFNFEYFQRLIVDESHFIKNPTSMRAISVVRTALIPRMKNVILLSGTPFEYTRHLFMQLRAIGAVECKYMQFCFKFCNPFQEFKFGKTVWNLNGTSNKHLLKPILDSCMLSMRKEDVSDLPEKIIQIVPLSGRITKKEKQEFERLSIDFDNFDFNEFDIPIATYMKEQGIKKLKDSIAHIKMRLESIHKIFIVAKHHEIIDELMESLNSFGVVKIDGRMSLEEKQNAVDTFQTDSSTRICIGQITAAGVGVTLTAASHVVLVEYDWSWSNLSQAIDRCHRIGQKNIVTAEILTIEDSLDSLMINRVIDKKENIKALQ